MQWTDKFVQKKIAMNQQLQKKIIITYVCPYVFNTKLMSTENYWQRI